MARILVVDDNADIRELVELVLAGDGDEVSSVASGRVALEQLAREVYDLVVCDLQMPDVDGAAVYRAITQRPAPRPAVLLITGYADAVGYEDFVRTVDVPVLVKPFDINELRAAVRRLLGRV
jgi:CheY-like chemotaxis protein